MTNYQKMPLLTRALTVTMIIVLSVALLLGATVGGIYIKRHVASQTLESDILDGIAHKTVLFIGDGMGENHIRCAQAYANDALFTTLFEHSGYVTTHSLELFPTDSAAAATALATGQKVENGVIARKDGMDIESISTYAKSKGYGVGIVTTDSLYGATPAGFSAHADDRGQTDVIIASQLSSGIDLFLGAGRSTYSAYTQQFVQQGYYCVDSYADLDSTKGKLLGTFDAVKASEGSLSRPTLSQLTDFAIQYMESNFANGYFLMIESAHIDKRSHSNDLSGMIDYLLDFSDAIESTCARLSTQSGVAVIVTADHETGSLEYSGESADQLNGQLYGSTSHTSRNVKYYIVCYTEYDVDLTKHIASTIDNTDIYRIIRTLLHAVKT